MGLKVVTEFIRRGTVVVWAYVYKANGDAVDPTGSIKVTIEDPDGTAVVTAQDMSQYNSTTGVYYYYYRTTTSVDEGRYTGLVLCTDGSGDTAIVTPGEFSFTMKAGIGE